AVLTKGPLGAVLVGLAVGVEALLTRSPDPILSVKPVRAVVVFVVLVVPWYAAASLSGGSAYAYDLVVRQNFVRFFHAFDHVKPFWFYAEAIWGDFFPFTLPALAAPFLLSRKG